MNEPTWIRIAAADRIPVREGRVVLVRDLEIAIFNVGHGRFLAVQNRCPHRGGPLADGIVSGGAVVCPLHAWKWNLETGGAERPSGQDTCLERYPVRVEDGIVMLGLPETCVTAVTEPVRREGEAA